MSRVGRAPVYFENNINVSVTPDNVLVVKGGKTEQKIKMHTNIKATIENGVVTLTRINDEPQNRAFHGLYRALLQNAVTGVSKGWTKELILNGVGYRASVSGRKLEMNLGYSHPILFDIPEGIEIKVEKQVNLTVTGADKGLVGQVAAKIRGFREPEPYLGKGIRYSDEHIRRKAGKSAGK